MSDGISASLTILHLKYEIAVFLDGRLPRRTDTFNMTETAFPRGQGLLSLTFGLQEIFAIAVDEICVFDFCGGDDVKMHDPAISAFNVGVPNRDFHILDFWIRCFDDSMNW